MGLKEKLTTDMKAAMKAREAERLATVRLLLSDWKKQLIDSKTELTEEDELQFLATQAKRRRESITAFEEGGRTEMAEQERTELAVIESYLPKQLTPDDVRAIIKDVVAATGAESMKDMGKVMGKLMPQLKGRFPGKDVQPLVKEALG